MKSEIIRIPLCIVITTTNRINSLKLCIFNLHKTRIELKKKGLDIRYSILSTNSNSERYKNQCKDAIKKYNNSIDYFYEINNSDSFDLHYRNLIYRIKELEIKQGNINLFYFLGDDDLLNSTSFYDICYSIHKDPQDVYINSIKKWKFIKKREKYIKYQNISYMYKDLWNQIKFGNIIYKPSFEKLEIINKKLFLDNQHLFSIHFWFSLSTIKMQKIKIFFPCKEFAKGLKIKKDYNNNALKLYLRDIPLAIILISKLLNLNDRSVISKYFLFRVGFLTPVGFLRSFYIIKSIIKGKKFSGSTFIKFIFMNQIYLFIYKIVKNLK